MLKKVISSILVFLFAITFLSMNIAKAEEVMPFSVNNGEVQSILNTNVESKYNNEQGYYYGIDFESLTKDEMEMLSNNSIRVTIEGVLVGIIIGGQIIYSTGKSAEEWVALAHEWTADALRWAGASGVVMVQRIQYRYRFRGVSWRGCVQRYPGGPWDCPY